MKMTSYGSIQWKGTTVSMDCYCLCGEHFHIDSDAPYYVQCLKCKQIYKVTDYVQLYPIESVPKGHIPPKVDDDQESRLIAEEWINERNHP
jgi:hypothetical protein